MCEALHTGPQLHPPEDLIRWHDPSVVSRVREGVSMPEVTQHQETNSDFNPKADWKISQLRTESPLSPLSPFSSKKCDSPGATSRKPALRPAWLVWNGVREAEAGRAAEGCSMKPPAHLWMSWCPCSQEGETTHRGEARELGGKAPGTEKAGCTEGPSPPGAGAEGPPRAQGRHLRALCLLLGGLAAGRLPAAGGTEVRVGGEGSLLEWTSFPVLKWRGRHFAQKLKELQCVLVGRRQPRHAVGAQGLPARSSGRDQPSWTPTPGRGSVLGFPRGSDPALALKGPQSAGGTDTQTRDHYVDNG